ncbi:hypothetical protein ILUMI_02338 [Ignelater luminosus]|uniref:Uncharacterized protein n=1 Tax=Ignelater luminosus TaxID=2038154 RepID=A0A8K0GGJ5_IGNLU|nr:hypothetical protein ILUMI_02338 [Ignelater luminosus]
MLKSADCLLSARTLKDVQTNTTSMEIQQVSNSVDLLLQAADIIRTREAAYGTYVPVNHSTSNAKNENQWGTKLPMASLLQQSLQDGISLLLLAAERVEKTTQICK